MLVGDKRSPFHPTDSSVRMRPKHIVGMPKMDQLGNFAGAAKQIAQIAHEHATGLGLAPVPTVIVVSLAAVFALVGLVVGGADRRRTGAHRA